MPRGKRNNWNGWRIGIEFPGGARLRWESGTARPHTPEQVLSETRRIAESIESMLKKRAERLAGAPHAPTQEKA